MNTFDAAMEYENLSERSKSVAVSMLDWLTNVEDLSLEEVKTETEKFVSLLQVHYPEHLFRAMCYASIFADSVVQSFVGDLVSAAAAKYKD